MTEPEQRDAMQQAIDTLSLCRARVVHNGVGSEMWIGSTFLEHIDKSTSGLMGLLANLKEPDL